MNDETNIILQDLKTKASNILIITGMGMTMQSSEKLNIPMDMRWLTNSLINFSGIKRNDGERTNEVLERWLETTSIIKQKEALEQVLHNELPIKKFTSWFKLFETDKPIITQSLDLHAAIAMYNYVYNILPQKLDDLHNVILTWDSELKDLELFFQGKSKKILYREGCILCGNWLLGKKNYAKGNKSPGMKFINNMMYLQPVLLVGTLAAIRTTPIKNKLQDKYKKKEIFRIVQKGTEQILFVNDILCDDYYKSFDVILNEVCKTLIINNEK
jgi:hypothetical protein